MNYSDVVSRESEYESMQRKRYEIVQQWLIGAMGDKTLQEWIDATKNLKSK